jgi:malonate-semialdehyde dehydrogenase (acetylating) / methylmalonate-semialdehyde dehydrogenase
MVANIGHFLGNKLAAGKSGRSGDVTNPATGEVTAKVAFASEAEIDAAVQAAKAA